jgi:hypothetical protein
MMGSNSEWRCKVQSVPGTVFFSGFGESRAKPQRRLVAVFFSAP